MLDSLLETLDSIYQLWPVLLLIILAVVFLQFTYVKEGTAKAVLRFDGFRKIIMKWEGYTLETRNVPEKGNVVPGEEPWLWRFLGGLRFVGIRFIDMIHKYEFRWRGIQLVNGKEETKFEKGTIDYIFVRPDVYETEIEKAETRPPERIPLSIRFLITMRVENPEKALFKAPSNWFENVMTKLNALLRGLVSELTLDNILKLKKSPEKIWEGFTITNEDGTDTVVASVRDDKLLKMFKEEWGIVIEENGIEIRDVDVPSDIQDAAEAERKQQLLAKGFSAETTGRLVAMIADLTNSKLEDVQVEFKTNLKTAWEKYQPVIQVNLDLIKRRLGVGSGQQEIYISSPEGLLAMLANTLRGGFGRGDGSTTKSIVDETKEKKAKPTKKYEDEEYPLESENESED